MAAQHDHSSIRRFWSDDEAMERLATELADQDERLRRALILLRKERGVSQADVAAVLGVTQPTVAAFERIDADPKLSTLRRYALAIGGLVTHEVSSADRWLKASTSPLPFNVNSAVGAANARLTDFALAA